MLKMRSAVVDVRDCAKAHLNAVLFPEVKNKRYLLVEKYMYFRDMGAVIHSKYGGDYEICMDEIEKGEE